MIFKRLAKALISLHVRAGWSEPLLAAHTTLLEISCHGSYNKICVLCECMNVCEKQKTHYNAFNVYCRELAPGTVSLTGDRAQGDDGKHWA